MSRDHAAVAALARAAIALELAAEALGGIAAALGLNDATVDTTPGDGEGLPVRDHKGAKCE